jgi:DNA polymerase elongation subunit (family B)
MAKKISLNSAYGAIGNQYFRYYKLANAEAITLSGQVAIRWIESKMNIYLNKLLKTEDVDYVIASDTDSIYLHMGPLVETVYKGRERKLLRALFRSLIRSVRWNLKSILKVATKNWLNT